MTTGEQADPSERLGALTRPELEVLWTSARARLERTGLSVSSRPLRLSGLSDDEVDAICGLLGRRRPAGNDLSIRLDVLDGVLRNAGFEEGLIEVVDELVGPLVDRRAARRASADARAELWSAAASHDANQLDGVAAWIESLRARGRVARLGASDPMPVLSDALAVVGWLLQRREHRRDSLPLSVVSAMTLGDAHALDPDAHVGVLVADAARYLADRDDQRTAWLALGVRPDRLSSSTLTFMLPGVTGTVAGAAASSGEPLRVTQRMVDEGFGLDLSALGRVWICENPAIVSLAADLLGVRCPPMVCLDGMPVTVTGSLLAQMRSADAALAVHCDFDFGGIAICAHILDRHAAQPWRMDEADYLAALSGPTLPLERAIAATPWSPGLAGAMSLYSRAIHEEALHEVLLSDLAGA